LMMEKDAALQIRFDNKRKAAMIGV
jgi:hypothetical protein